MNKMKMLSVLAGAVLLSLSSTAAFAATFDFTDTFLATNYGAYWAGPAVTVTGSFTGTASGNLITDLSNVSVFVDGVGFGGNGVSVMSFTYTGAGETGFVPGGVVSFDGSQNNFQFIDYAHHDGSGNPLQVYDISQLGLSEVIGATVRGEDGDNNWSVSQVSPVPLPAALPMFGAAVAGFAAWGRKRRAKQKAA